MSTRQLQYSDCLLVCKISPKIVDCYNELERIVGELAQQIPSFDHILHLPAGLGIKRDLDDADGVDSARRKRRFLCDMDAMIVLQPLTWGRFSKILGCLPKFRKKFGSLKGRAWTVFNRFGGLCEQALYSSPSSPRSAFNGVAEVQSDSLIPDDQVLFLETQVTRQQQRDADFDAAAFLHVKGNDVGEIILPVMTKYPHMEKAFLELLKDGGISSLREVVGKTGCRAVASRVHLRRGASASNFRQGPYDGGGRDPNRQARGRQRRSASASNPRQRPCGGGRAMTGRLPAPIRWPYRVAGDAGDLALAGVDQDSRLPGGVVSEPEVVLT